MTLEVLEKRVHMAMEATTGSRLEYRRPVGKSTFTEWMPVNEARLFDVLMEDDVELRRGPAQAPAAAPVPARAARRCASPCSEPAAADCRPRALIRDVGS